MLVFMICFIAFNCYFALVPLRQIYALSMIHRMKRNNKKLNDAENLFKSRFKKKYRQTGHKGKLDDDVATENWN